MKIDHKVLQAYLDGGLSEEENLQVQAWLADHMDSPEVVSLLNAAFDNSRMEADKSDEAFLATVRQRLGITRKRPATATIWLAAAVAILLLCLPLAFRTGYRLHQDPQPVVWNEIQVPFAQTRDITLPDGTLLTLNAGSRLTWPDTFTGNSREIFLEGEVMARVVKDPEHPLVIHAGDVDVRVHGTTFNFKSYREETMVEMLLLEGSVSMDVPHAEGKREIRLAPGQIALYDRREGDISLSRISTENYKPFSEGRSFSFFNVPLSDIAANLERSFAKKIILADEKVAGRRFLAFFTNGESLDEILSLLAHNGSLRISHAGDAIYISGKK